MRRILLLLIATQLMAICSYGQLNVNLVSHLVYSNDELSNIWGYTHPDGTEYALVGTTSGVSIVSLADPANPQELFLIPGSYSIWRELKTWEDHAYVVTDQPGSLDGMLVIDLSQLPNAAPYYNWQPNLPDLGVLERCHTIFIDEFGIAYLNGSNLNEGGLLFVDVDTDPNNPVYLGKTPPIYCHDSYARDNILYTADIYAGVFTVYNVADKANPVFLADQGTPYAFTHNVWLTDDSQVIFTTDERPNASVASYQITDLGNIVELDQFRPYASLNTSTIPHNVHVWDDWLLVSYYTDGVIVVDGSRPDNLVEVGNFDTFLGPNGGFNGAWGVFPYFESGRIIVSDINNGLWVFEPNYIRACWLEGTVTSQATGEALNAVNVQILSDELNGKQTDPLGVYKTGQATAGTFMVRFEKMGYKTKEVEAILQNGVVTILNVALEPLVAVNIGGLTLRSDNGAPVPFAQIKLVSETASYDASSNINGDFVLNGIYTDTYDVYAGAWGYRHKVLEGVQIAAGTSLTITLDAGYQDDFIFDFGWQATADSEASSGYWVKGNPNGTSNGGAASNPGDDLPNDLGDECYVTGNGASGNAGADDVDGGTVTLTSPAMDLTGYMNPKISYNIWFYNDGGNSTPNDSLTVSISNGTEVVQLEAYHFSYSDWHPRAEILIGGLLALTSDMRLIVTTGDYAPGHLVEGGLDAFLVEDEIIISSNEVSADAHVSVFPNPSQSSFTLEYQIEQSIQEGRLKVWDVLGLLVAERKLSAGQGSLTLGGNWQPGIYYVQLFADGRAAQTLKVVKQ